jgi:dihydrofolate reductase
LRRGCPLRGRPFVNEDTPPQEVEMGRVIVIEFVSVDGVMEDPDGRGGFEHGGWAFRYGPETVAGDKFKLGELFDTGALLLGRRTWQLFAQLWPARDDPFSAKMNAVDKLVASRTLTRVDEWQNSRLLQHDLLAEVQARKATQDLIVAGSASVAKTLIAHDLVDEFRLLVFPLVIGTGTRLFEGGTPVELEVVVAEQVGAAVLLTHRRRRESRDRVRARTSTN